MEDIEAFVVLERRADGSFVIDREGLPYHVPRDWAEWQKIDVQWRTAQGGAGDAEI